MGIFSSLQNNKGTVSSALGKELAQKALNGNSEILHEAVELCVYEAGDEKQKHIRSGAAKIVEIVAEEKPETVTPYLERLLPALTVSEPQTRWMIIRTMGFCAALAPDIAERAIEFADRYIVRKEGLCIASSADLFLGDYGAISPEKTGRVFPILEKSVNKILMNEQDWLLEAFIKIAGHLTTDQKKKVEDFAREYEQSSRNTTRDRVKKLLVLL